MLSFEPTPGGVPCRPVVVTGASRGIGRALALELARRDIPCALLGRASAAMETTISQFEKLGGRGGFAECDVADPASIDAVGELLRASQPRALINNAGVAERRSLAELDLDSYERQMRTNLLGPLWLTRALLPALLQAKRAAVVNVGSISATLGTANQTVYNASKWALTGFTKSLAEELTDTSVMVVVVHPGAVATSMLAGSGFAPRMSPHDVASTLLYFALDAPLAHNGASIEMFGT